MDEELGLARLLIQSFPACEDPLIILGNLYSRRGDTDQAQALWQQALDINPQRSEVYRSMAELAQQTDRLQEAVQLWQRALDCGPKTPGLRGKMADALLTLGQFQTCIEHARAEMTFSGPDPQQYWRIGRAHQSLEEYTRARENFAQAIQLQPDHLNAFYGLYSVCMRLRDRETAQKALQTYQALKAKRKKALRNQSETDLDCGFASLARFYVDTYRFQQRQDAAPVFDQVLDRALVLGQANASFLKPIARFLAEQGQRVGALELMEGLARLEPDDVTWLLNVGALAVQLKRFDAAERALLRAIQVDPNEVSPYRQLTRLAFNTGRNLERAQQLARRAVELDPGAPTYLDLGLVFLAAGKRAQGLQALEQALALEPDDVRIRQAYEIARKKGGAAQ